MLDLANMRAAYVLLLALLLAGFVGALAFTPALVFGEPDLAPEAGKVGHLAAHAAPALLCSPQPGGTQRHALVADEVGWDVTDGTRLDGWAFNGSMPGPALCANLGDVVEVTVENRLAVPLLFHLHLPSVGEAGPVAPGARATFVFTAAREGAHLYHDVANGNEGLARGLHGLLLVRNGTPDVDHEIQVVLGEVQPQVHPDTYAGTVNGKAFPRIPHFVFAKDERVLVHLVNAGPGEEHTLHVHGHRWRDAGDGRVIDNKFLSPHARTGHPDLPQYEGVIPMAHALAADTATFLFLAEEEGEWMVHCHVYDHINAGMMGMLTVGEATHHG